MALLRHAVLLSQALLVSSGCASDGEQALPAPRDGGLHADTGSGDVSNQPCTPMTCAQSGAECGTAPDGCGGKVECGTCASGKYCGGSGPNRCGTQPCTPKTCETAGAACGNPSDGCAAVLDCGSCSPGRTCSPTWQCECAPLTCSQAGAQCGMLQDGCGDMLNCGGCPGTQVCGGETPNQCSDKPCEPTTCAKEGVTCGSIPDKCQGTLECGSCTLPQSCGGGGVAGQCGCTPVTCAQKGKDCGSIDNGCGAAVDCGSCTAPEVCAGAGVSNVCGCNPTACPPFYTNSFEYDSDFPAGWSVWHNCAADETWTVQRDVYPAPGGGSWNLRFHTTAFQAGCQWPGAYALTPSLPASPGKTYRAEFWVRDGGNAGGLAFIFYDGAEQEIGYAEGFWQADAWVYHANPSVVAVAPAGADHLRLRVYLNAELQYADFDLLEVYLDP